MENHHFYWVNPLFLWPFSIATLVYQRVTPSNETWEKNTSKFLQLGLRRPVAGQLALRASPSPQFLTRLMAMENGF
jgi:hypothetical protein